MKGIEGLKSAVSKALQKRIDEEAKAKHGTMKDGLFVSGNKSYPAIQAVDVDTSGGSRVWAQLDRNGNAVIVGA